MNVGMTLCFMPMLLATSLNSSALSAMRSTSVYASAVSNTPGPVSVSGVSGAAPALTMALDFNPKRGRLGVQVVKVVLVHSRAQEGVSVV